MWVLNEFSCFMWLALYNITVGQAGVNKPVIFMWTPWGRCCNCCPQHTYTPLKWKPPASKLINEQLRFEPRYSGLELMCSVVTVLKFWSYIYCKLACRFHLNIECSWVKGGNSQNALGTLPQKMFLILQAQWEIDLSSNIQKGFGAIILYERMASQDGNRYWGPLAVGILGR